ncbi:retrotransposon-related protein [Trifolium pratense]|uniref:Retrotransposon-related protein n=1 Tax=Trifolium pratense TaxID=57577 RepID=A0A2K3NZ72_TRIPR|nr:retrotransposon-related protein [Trifolium pratense]
MKQDIDKRFHQCASKQLRVLILGDDEFVNDDGEIVGVEVDSEEEKETEELECKSFGVFGLEGGLQGANILALIDSGATHNFISPKVVEALGLVMVPSNPLGIKLGDGPRVMTMGKCVGISMVLGDMETTLDAYILELGGVDLILGVVWLETLGKVTMDWKEMSMLFTYKGNLVKLVGQPLDENMATFQNLMTTSRVLEEDNWHTLLTTKEVSDQGLHEVKDGALQALLTNFRDCLLQQGVIPNSTSAFSSPVILVKKDNSWCMCIDYRALNKVTVQDKYPIPVVDELLDELHGSTYFSKLDLKSGYHQIRMKEEDIHKTAFRTHEGRYGYMVMPFGLTNAPATFQSHQFVANKGKCAFGQERIEYLGHVISKAGVTVDPSKADSVLQWPVPKNVKGVRGFLGLTGYYRKFIANDGKFAKPLTGLTKKDGFHWNTAAEEAFQQLKIAVTSAPVLALPDFTLPFEIECDASSKGVGAVLMQLKHPIAYFSKAFASSKLSKSAYDKELMALVLAIQH